MKLSKIILSNIQQINQIECKFLRDMVSLLYSPTVFSYEFEEQQFFQAFDNNNFESINEFYEQVANVPTPIDATKLRLGLYAEKLLLHFLQNNSQIKFIAHNIQLNDNKITKGEIDFLFEDLKSESKVHLELAVKFYLKVQSKNTIEWIGPSSKDRLSRKKSHLINHQLQLTRKYKDLLPLEFQKHPFQEMLYLKGAAFFPYSEYTINANPLQNAWWLHFSSLFELKAKDNLFSIIFDRKDWIFPFNNRLTNIDFSELIKLIPKYLEIQNEIMIARYTSEGDPIDRGFIVKNNWPN